MALMRGIPMEAGASSFKATAFRPFLHSCDWYAQQNLRRAIPTPPSSQVGRSTEAEDLV